MHAIPVGIQIVGAAYVAAALLAKGLDTKGFDRNLAQPWPETNSTFLFIGASGILVLAEILGWSAMTSWPASSTLIGWLSMSASNRC